MTAAAGRRARLGAYLYLVPAFVIIGAFLVLPLLKTLEISLYDWNLISPSRTFVGVGNYRTVMANSAFVGVLWQSALYVLIAIAGTVIVPLFLALLTVRVTDREADAYQTLIFLPTVVPVSIGALLFLWIYSPTGGIFNAVLGLLHLPRQNWLNDPHWALLSVSFVGVWKFFGFNYLVLLAGLKAIPASFLEAAAIDGARGLALFRRITVPLLTPTLLFAVVTTILQALDHVFVPIQILTLGGPSGASTNLIYATYQDGFQFFQAGKASAEATIYLALFAGFAIWQFRMFERYTHYDG